MKTRSIARPNTVYSVKLRQGGYALLQTMSDTCRIAVFDEFRSEPDWTGVQLSQSNVLFICSVIRNFFQNSLIEKLSGLTACRDLEFPNKAISLDGHRTVTLTVGKSKHEIVAMGDGLSLCHTKWHDGRPSLSYTNIKRTDFEKVKHLELTTLRSYPELNERLSLCRKLGRNVDPMKEIAFDRQLPPQFETYVVIIGGLIPSKQFGY